jgi:two-component system OmpR family sensor kinase
MKRAVFWKILIGFWVTTLLITQGVWLMFNVLRPVPQPNESSIRTLNVAVIAAAALIARDGKAAFDRDFQHWPAYLRNQIEVRPAADAPGAGGVAAPDGQTYRIIAHPQPRRREHARGPLDVPWQVLLVSFFGGLGFSAVLAWYLTAPVQRIRAGFGALAKGDFSIRLGPSVGRRRDEIADLAHDFDMMAKRLDELVNARDRLLAGVSHELRSPLARLQLAIGLARQDPAKVGLSLDRISREAARLDEMVGELLTLSKLESGAGRTEDYFDLAEIVKRVAEDAGFEAAPMGVCVQVEIHPGDENRDWIVLGNGKLMSRAVENIVRNAIRFSGKGQQVRIVLERQPDGFCLTVADQGPGVPEAELGALFKPFVQGAGGDGKGFGLGLAIAERAVTAHGGAMTARNASSGGLAIAVRIPAAEIDC